MGLCYHRPVAPTADHEGKLAVYVQTKKKHARTVIRVG